MSAATIQASSLSCATGYAKAPRAKRCAVAVRAQRQAASETPMTRRAVSLAALAAVTSAVVARPANAGLFGPSPEEYEKETTAIIAASLATFELAKDNPAREGALKAARQEINGWVAKYRRDPKFAGRPSFGNTYSAVNGLAGHINSFGYKTPVPAKRAERMIKELADAEKLLARGR